MENNTLKPNEDIWIHWFDLEDGTVRWDVESKSQQTSHIKLNLENWGELQIKGFEDQKEIHFDVKPFESKTLCVLIKGPNFKENPTLTVTIDQIKVARSQNRRRGARVANKATTKVWNDILKIPFEVLDEDELEDRIRALGHDHFVDPSFPPDDSSLYDITNSSEYPLEEKAVWKRPHQFMRFGEIELFEDDKLNNFWNKIFKFNIAKYLPQCLNPSDHSFCKLLFWKCSYAKIVWLNPETLNFKLIWIIKLIQTKLLLPFIQWNSVGGVFIKHSWESLTIISQYRNSNLRNWSTSE